MIELHEPFSATKKVLGAGKKEAGTVYVKSAFITARETEDGILLYNSFLKCLILVTEEEYKDFLSENAPADTEAGRYFYENYFLVPAGTDEVKIVSETKAVLKLLQKKKPGLYSFTVLPTTNCNARCFYCYEAGCEKMSMTEETADKLVERMLTDRVEGKNISVHWFGGEPLYNMPIIDYVSKKLAASGETYEASMISNAYLFDAETAEKAVTLWNLKEIQITLDGTRDVYNKRKAFIYDDPDPFCRVFKNIGILLDKGVRVSVRLNMDRSNSADLRTVAHQLKEAYGDRMNLRVYAHLLYQAEAKDDEKLTRDFFAFKDELEEMGLNRGTLRFGVKLNRCMADSENSAVVLPDGSLNACEHFNEVLPPYGAIDTKEKNPDIYPKWQETFGYAEQCRTCAFMPDCIRLKECPEENGTCTKVRQALRADDMKRGMLTEYKKWKRKEEQK